MSGVPRVTGLGGVFFTARHAPELQAWYRRHLGIDVQAWGGATLEGPPGPTVWAVMPAASTPFAPSASGFMVNYRVADVQALAQVLREEGCQVLEVGEATEHGTFAWVMDPEGNKVELWQPPDAA